MNDVMECNDPCYYKENDCTREGKICVTRSHIATCEYESTSEHPGNKIDMTANSTICE